MSALVIVGRYPFPGKRLEGMLQRITNIDAKFADRSRTYLDLYGFKHFRAKNSTIGQVQVYTASFLHFLRVAVILRNAGAIYVHSIYFYALIFLPLLMIGRSARLILDVHGAVPEENSHAGRPFLSILMGWVERSAFSRAETVVCVTHKMCEFYREKYPRVLANFLYLPIFTSQVCRPADESGVASLRSEYKIPPDATVYLYSGGLQPWQNIDRMLQVVRSVLSRDGSWCIFLSGEASKLSEMVQDVFGAMPGNLIVTYAKSEDLRYYYEMADFGFILRDDHVLNRIANPTKLVEYLYFGVRPIVLSPDIGDFFDLGYEYVCVDDVVASDLDKRKSDINRKISLSLLEDASRAKLGLNV